MKENRRKRQADPRGVKKSRWLLITAYPFRNRLLSSVKLLGGAYNFWKTNAKPRELGRRTFYEKCGGGKKSIKTAIREIENGSCVDRAVKMSKLFSAVAIYVPV